PEYQSPRNTWREAAHRAVAERQRATPVRYAPNDRLEVSLRLYFTDKRAVEIHDVDNRLKDCLDALQGRAGGSKAVRSLPAIVPNDRQIWRVVVQKGLAPKQAHGLGHLTIRRFNPD
ncbi:MAG: hypothetical protein ACRD2A_00390, partial [Vicinamibacterales bacterium]